MYSMSTAAMEAQFRETLRKIANDPRYTAGDLVDVMSFIIENAAEALDCARVSVWFYMEAPSEHSVRKSIQCLRLYDRHQGGFVEDSTILTENEAGTYIGALEKDTVLIMDDVATDPRCVELMREYLPSHNITSMLDAPFQFNGSLAGVMCCEHVGEARNWDTAEQHFAENMASLLSISQESQHRRNVQAELTEEQERYRSLVDELPEGMVIVLDGRIVFANKQASVITHIDTVEDLVGMHISTLFPPVETWESEEWEKAVQTGPQQPTEYRFALQDGTRVTFEVMASSVTWLGKPAVQAIFRDVTEAAYANLRLRRSERLLSQAQRIAKLGSWVWDLETGHTECSAELRSLLSIQGGNPLVEPLSSLAHPEDAPRLNVAQARAISEKQNYQIIYRVESPKGTVWLEEIGVPELGPEQKVVRIHGTSRDITEQKLAELEARETEERFSSLSETFPGGFIYCDVDERYLFINAHYADDFQISADDFLGRHIQEAMGDARYLELKPHIETVLSGRSVTFEMAPDGFDDDKLMQITFAPDVGVSGDMRGFFGLHSEITEQKRVERALRQAQKMEAMGQLTGGIAHDFNNILAILMGNLELARSTTSDKETQEYISAALQGVERGVAITQKLLGFARSNTPEEQLVQINSLIDDLGDILVQSTGPRISLHVTSEEDIWTARIDTGDFEDALINLAINARDAMPDGGTLLINTSNKTLDDSYHRVHPHLKPGDYVLLSVSDTGKGMSAQTRERLFEPFFTTKPEGKGTGLGMSMVFGFVKRSRGEVVVYSAEGEGTTINIYLPRASGDLPRAKPAPPRRQARAEQETILIVDDE